MAQCITCNRPWVEWSTLCGNGCCSTDCLHLHNVYCKWCDHIRNEQGQGDPSKETE